MTKRVALPTRPVIDKGVLRELVSGAQKIFENAESLFNEARLLRANGFFVRALGGGADSRFVESAIPRSGRFQVILIPPVPLLPLRWRWTAFFIPQSS